MARTDSICERKAVVFRAIEGSEAKSFRRHFRFLFAYGILGECVVFVKVYLTNAVKHFKWEPRGKRRIHKTPNAAEIAACRPRLDAEIATLKPGIIVCLGATAAQALLGREFRATQHRGTTLESPLAPRVMATVHPSANLRTTDEATRREEMKRFIQDLRKITAQA